MSVKNIFATLFGFCVLTACSNKGLDEWVPLEDADEAHISLNFPAYDLEKYQARIYRKPDGWAETAEWRSVEGAEVRVRIYANVSYYAVFMESGITPLKDLVRRVSGDGYVDFGDSGRVDTQYGFYEYQFYSASGIPCALIQGYWADKSFAGVDIVRGTKATDRIVGNHALQAYFCDAGKQAIGADELADFMQGINLRDAHWPDDIFTSAD